MRPDQALGEPQAPASVAAASAQVHAPHPRVGGWLGSRRLNEEALYSLCNVLLKGPPFFCEFAQAESFGGYSDPASLNCRIT